MAGRRKMKVERKKERRKRRRNRGNQAFGPIMERELGKVLERSEGTNSIAQRRRSQQSQL